MERYGWVERGGSDAEDDYGTWLHTDTSETWSVTSIAGPCTPLPAKHGPHTWVPLQEENTKQHPPHWKTKKRTSEICINRISMWRKILWCVYMSVFVGSVLGLAVKVRSTTGSGQYKSDAGVISNSVCRSCDSICQSSSCQGSYPVTLSTSSQAWILNNFSGYPAWYDE